MKFLIYLCPVICLLISCGGSPSDKVISETKNNKAELERQKEIQDSINLVKEDEIREKLKENIWLKNEDKNRYFLYTYTDSSLALINCKGSVNYSLVVDTLKFHNDSSTMAIVSLNENGDLLLKDIKTGAQGVFKVARDQDKFIGNWTGQLKNLKINLFKLKLKPEGKGSLTDGNGTYSSIYSFKKNKLMLNSKGSVINFKTNLARLNTMSETNSIWYRKMKPFPTNLSILF
tara:strand:+ start:203 stop:898 length:696 start_codon:yes stop_codon:yes gene_type:complete